MFGNVTTNVDGGFIVEDQGSDVPAVNDRATYIWRVGTNPNIGTINNTSLTSAANIPFELKLNDIQAIWLAVAANSTFTGATVGDIRLKAAFRWIGLGEVSTAHSKKILVT